MNDSKLALAAVAADAYSDYLVACNVTDSYDRFTPIGSETWNLWVLSTSIEHSKGLAYDYITRAAFGPSFPAVTE